MSTVTVTATPAEAAEHVVGETYVNSRNEAWTLVEVEDADDSVQMTFAYAGHRCPPGSVFAQRHMPLAVSA